MNAMLRDLRVMVGWGAGYVELVSETACIKDPKTNLVVKMVQRPLTTTVADDDGLTDGCHHQSSPKAVSNRSDAGLFLEGSHGGIELCGLTEKVSSVGRVDSFIGCAY